MNQILFTPNYISGKKFKSLKLYFRFSILLLLFTIFYFISKVAFIHKNEQISKVLLSYYTASRTYSEAPINYTLNLDNKDNVFSVIGIIEIEKINIRYPILSDISDYLLTISPCRFYGPMPNEIR